MKIFVSIVGFVVGFILGYITPNMFASANTKTITIHKVEPIVIKTITIERLIEHTPVNSHSDTKSTKQYKLTAYCCENYPHICNNGDSTKTSTGTTPTPGRTVAVDPNVIPYGSEVIINGHTYIAEDCGGGVKGNRVDILFATHEEALRFGVQYAEVEIIEPTIS